MSIAPFRDPLLLNKFFDASDPKRLDYQERRPCIGSKQSFAGFCDDEFFRRLDVGHPFRDAYFPRFPHATDLYKKPSFAVDGGARWGDRINNELSEWRTSFPDRQNGLEGNTMNCSTGMAVLKPALQTIAHGHKDLSPKRLRRVERQSSAKAFHTRWDRFREGAPSITSTPFIQMAQTHAHFGGANKRRSYSQGSLSTYDSSN